MKYRSPQNFAGVLFKSSHSDQDAPLSYLVPSLLPLRLPFLDVGSADGCNPTPNLPNPVVIVWVHCSDLRPPPSHEVNEIIHTAALVLIKGIQRVSDVFANRFPLTKTLFILTLYLHLPEAAHLSLAPIGDSL